MASLTPNLTPADWARIANGGRADPAYLLMQHGAKLIAEHLIDPVFVFDQRTFRPVSYEAEHAMPMPSDPGALDAAAAGQWVVTGERYLRATGDLPPLEIAPAMRFRTTQVSRATLQHSVLIQSAVNGDGEKPLQMRLGLLPATALTAASCVQPSSNHCIDIVKDMLTYTADLPVYADIEKAITTWEALLHGSRLVAFFSIRLRIGKKGLGALSRHFPSIMTTFPCDGDPGGRGKMHNFSFPDDLPGVAGLTGEARTAAIERFENAGDGPSLAFKAGAKELSNDIRKANQAGAPA